MARRVNKKFLVIVTLVICGALVAAVVLKRLHFHGASYYADLGEKQEAAGNLEEAGQDYGRAFNYSKPQNPAYAVKLGDVYMKETPADPKLLGSAVGTWRKALEVDPNYAPALTRLVNVLGQEMQMGVHPETLNLLAKYAEQLHKVDPSDKNAAAWVKMAPVEAYLGGVATDPVKLESQLKDLQKVYEDDPTNVQAMMIMAQARLRLSQAAGQQNDTDESDRQRNLALGTFDDALKKQPKSADVYIHAAQIDGTILRALQMRVAAAEQTGLSQADVDKWSKTLGDLRKQCIANLEHGQSLLDPASSNYEDLAVLAIEVHADLNQESQGIELAKQLLKNRPDSLEGRLLYARFIKQTPGKWADAVAVLTAPTSPNSIQPGVKVGLVKYQQMSLLNELAEIRCDQCATETDPAKKAQLLTEVQDDYTKLVDEAGETPQTLKLHGRILQLQGKQLEAIQALEKAQAAYQHQGQFDIELTNALAMTYWHVGQTGQARKMFKQILDANPGYLPPRFMLTELLLEENDAKDAEPHIQMLERILPNNPSVIELRITSDIAQGNLDHAKSLYAKLPEKTVREQAVKAQLAQKLKDLSDATRLVEKIHQANPNDLASVEWLCQLYLQNNQRDAALKLVDEAMSAHPNEQALQLMKQQALATSPQQRAQIAQQAVEQSKLSPASKEIQLYEIARQQEKPDEAMQHLDKAEQLAPNDPQVLEMRFANYLIQKKWDDAQKYLDRLSKASPDNALIYQQELELARGNYDQAIDLANQIIVKMPEFASGYVAMGEALQAEGRYQEAIDKYLDALERQNNNLRSIQGLINCYYALNRPQDAARYIAQARRANADEPLFKEMEIEHSLKYGDGTLAITAREAEANAKPNDASAQNALGVAYLRAATYRLQQNDNSGAQPYIDKLQKLIADGMQKWPDNRGFFELAGELSLANKDFASGQAAMNRMIAQPQWMDDPQTYAIVADFYRQFNKMDLAETAMHEALDKGGGVQYRMELAALLSERGEPDKALALLDPLLETPEIDAEKAKILIAAHREAQAEPIVQALLAKNPNSPDLQKQLLNIEAAEGKIDTVMQTATDMLAKNPKNDTALYFRAVARMNQASPDIDGATHDLQAVLQDDPNNIDTRYELAQIYQTRNDWDSAITQLQQAIAAQPKNRDVRLKLIQLDSTATPPRWDDVQQLINTALADPIMQSDPTWQMAAAKMWQSRGDAGQCIAAYQAALKLEPNNQTIIENYVDALLWAKQPDQVMSLTQQMAQQKNAPMWVHMHRAMAAHLLNQPEVAHAELVAGMNAPDATASSDSIMALVQTATATGQTDAALQDASGKIAADARWQLFDGYLQHAKGDDTKAAQIMTQAATSAGSQLTPDEKLDAARWASMLNMVSNPPDYEKAVAMSKLVLAMQPDNTEQLNNLACMLVDSVKPSRPADALQYSQRAYDLMKKSGRTDPLIQDTQGWVLVNNGRVQDGILLLRQVVDNKPFVDAYYHLAEAYLRSNQPGAAQTQLKLASQTIDDLKRNKQPFDATLPERINAAQREAKDMSKMQASAPR
ncbi:MAG TPA: tetratricopeptide repeat protein [Tepidisphaeraceae bacterium]|jgi:tetratricopeptide (TPR) repeat protein